MRYSVKSRALGIKGINFRLGISNEQLNFIFGY